MGTSEQMTILIRVPSNDVDVISTNLIKCTAFYDLGERILCEVSRFTTRLPHQQPATGTVNLDVFTSPEQQTTGLSMHTSIVCS